MREIKFRGRCGKHWLGSELYGKWVYGDLIHSARCTISNNSNRMQYFVDEETVGQYTGLKDKNGKEIYEGDILAYQLKDSTKMCLGEVRFDKGMFYAKWYECIYYRMDLEYWSTRVEVVGNIYENPELLIDEDLRVLGMESEVYSKKI